MRKNVFRSLLVLSLLWADNASAAYQAYKLLVPIPGLSKTEGVNIGEYLQALYGFLIAIIAIVALAMIVLGGMKYITAAGNSSKTSDAKDTIMNAILGLLLGVFSWIILVTINPDLQFVKQPGIAFQNGLGAKLTSGCGFLASGACVCGDGDTITVTPDATTGRVSLAACDTACQSQGKCVRDNGCIAPGSVSGSADSKYDPNLGCTCLDNSKVLLSTGQTNCSVACKDAQKCGFKFLVVKLNMNHGATTNDNAKTIYVTTDDDALWNLNLTNNGSFGDFNVTAEHKLAGVGASDAGKFSCALLVTNEVNLGADHNYIYWVHEGQTINNMSTDPIYYQLLKPDNSRNYIGCGCTEEPDCAMDNARWGAGSECDAGEADKVLLSVFGDRVEDSCEDCSFAVMNGAKPTFRPFATITCKNGSWR